MDHNQFQEWLSGVDGLGRAERLQLQGVLLGQTEAGVLLEAIEARLAENRQCPHCNTPGAISRGTARGATTLSAQGLQEDLQRSNWHRFTGFSQKGQVAHLWGVPH